MKIALLSFEYPPETGFGGIGTYTWYQARALARLGHEVHVLAGATAPTPLRSTVHDGVTVHRFRAGGLATRPLGLLGRYRLWWTKNRLENGWSMYRGLAALQRRHSFDLIEMPECGAEGWLLNHLARQPTVVRFHSPAQLIMGAYDVPAADVRWCSAVERWGIRGARAFTSCSRFLADEVHGKLDVQAPIEVIPNGIDLGLFDAAEQFDMRAEYGLPANQPVILFTGRMEARKGIHLCPEIAGSILERRAVSFVFAGRDLFGYMQDTLLPSLGRRRLRGSVHHLGEIPLTAVRSCVRQADVFFLPSLWENCPYSILEAMAAGRAIVCSDQGGMPELIRDGETGLLARSGDAASYIERLDRVLDDARLRQRLGEAARRTVETSLTDVHIAERSLAFYRQCLAAG